MTTQSVLLVPLRADAMSLAETEFVLENHRMAYRVAHPPEDVIHAVLADPPDLVILQGGRISASMLDLLRQLQARRFPVLVLVQQLTEDHEALLLGSGALDVLGLPVSPKRLRARIVTMHRYLALQRETGEDEREEVVVRGDLTIDLGRREVKVGDTEVELTKTEFDLLVALARHPRQVLTREELSVQGMHGRPLGAHALESHLSRLRNKIIEAGGGRFIEAVRGVGYRLGVS